MSQVMPPSDDSSDAALVRLARNGDRDAFGALVRRHQERVFRLAGRFFRRRDQVEDASQDTFLRAWERLHTYAGRAPFEHWLTRVCLNTCYQRLRRERPTEALPADVAQTRSDDSDARVDAERLLGRLAPEDRFVLLLLHAEEWTTAEIAERLGWSRSRVKVRAHRARRRLRRLVEGNQD